MVEDRNKVGERVRKCVAEVLSIDINEVKGSDRFEDIGDSLDYTEIIMAVETEFHIDVSDEDAERLNTVGDMIRWLEENM